MMITRTVNYGWNTINQQYTATCKECTKRYTRTISAGYNDLADTEYRTARREKLYREAIELSNKPITCISCQKGNIKEPVIVDIIDDETLCEVDTILQLDRDLRERCKNLRAKFQQHNGRLFFYKDELYAQNGYSIADYTNDFIICGYRVNKRCPWETTDKYVNAPFREIRYCDDTLQGRKEAIKQAGAL